MSEKQTLPTKHDPVSPASPDVVEQAPEASPFMAALLQRQAMPPPIKPKQKDILHLQRLLGNAATQRYLHSSPSKVHLQRERVVDDDLDLRLPATLPSYDDFVTLVSQQRALRARMIVRSDGGEHILDILRTHSNLQTIYHQIETLYSAGGGSVPTTLHAQLHYEDSPGDTSERVDHIDFSLPGVTTVDFDDDRISVPPREEGEREFGLESPTSRAIYVDESLREIIPRWPSMAPIDRRIEVFRLINRRLLGLGIPPVSGSPVSLAPDINAQFDGELWAIEYEEARFASITSAADINHLLSDFYHEARHAEQLFLAIRYIYAAVSSIGRWDVTGLIRYPGHVIDWALAANERSPLRGREREEARQYYEQLFGEGGHGRDFTAAVYEEHDAAGAAYREAQRNGTQEELRAARKRYQAAIDAYRALIGEIDSYDVGGEVRAQLDAANPEP